MSDVLVAGGTGVLGRVVVSELLARGHDVRVLSRRASSNSRWVPDGARLVTGDLVTGDGLAEAVAGADTIVHSASDPRRFRKADVPGTVRLLHAAADSRPHVVYVSIVGCDRIPYAYYQTKVACEAAVARSGLPWTVLRATQFHDLVLTLAHLASRPPVVLAPRGVHVQPCDVRDVAPRLADLVDAGPAGRAPDFGGPQVLSAHEVFRAVALARGRRRWIVDVPLAGKVYAGYRAGHHLLAGGDTGSRTFDAYLAEHVPDGGRVDVPYRLR